MGRCEPVWLPPKKTAVFYHSPERSVEIAQLSLEYLRTIAWPLVTVILLVTYRKNLSNFFPRLSGVETPGFSATFESSSAEAAAVGSSAQNSSPIPTLDNMVTIEPTSYVAAREIGDALRSNKPVLMDLTELDEAHAKRLVDFCAGTAYLSYGSIQKVSSRVFIVTPGRVWAPKPQCQSHEEQAAPSSSGATPPTD